MPDTKEIGRQDRRIGAGGLASAVSPLMAQPDQFIDLNNMSCDIPGFASIRRGIQDLDHANHYSALSGLSTSYKPQKVWCFDNHLFVYLEDGSNHGAIAAYDLIGSTWQIVYAGGSAQLRMDSGSRKIAQKAFNKTSLICTNVGVKRLSALYQDSGTSNYTYSSALRAAGVPRALDPRCKSSISSGGTDHGWFNKTGYNWLLRLHAVAYRTCLIYRDENGILKTGAASGKIVVRNTDASNDYAVRLKVVIPTGLDTRYVYQIYRTNTVGADGTGAIPDPGDDQFEVGEYQLTPTDISNGYFLFEDVSFDGLLQDALYTNESQEGADQARFQPPMARCLERFGNCAWYGDVTEKQRLTVKFLAVDSSGSATGIRAGDHISVGDITMVGVAPAAEETTTWNFAIDASTGLGSEVIRALKTTESFVYKYNTLSNTYNGRFFAYNLTSDNDIYGVIGFEEKGVGTTYPMFMSADRVDSPTQILPYPGLFGAFNDRTSRPASVTIDVTGNIATLSFGAALTVSAGDKVIVTPWALSNATAGGVPILAVTHVPAGEYSVLSAGLGFVTIDTTGVGAVPSSTDVLDATHGCYFFVETSVSAKTTSNARSQNTRILNRVYWSSPGEFEAAPIVNFKDFGDAASRVQAIVATVSSIFIFKDDGVWRGRGTDGDWTFELMDAACRVLAPNSVAVVAGDIYAYTTTGFVRVTDSGISKISTGIGTTSDTWQRTILAGMPNARFMEGIANNEDQAYVVTIPASANSLGAYTVLRYHVPSKHWSSNTYNDNASSPGVYTIGGICMAIATRYDATANTQVYIERMVVAHNSVANSIGIERRDGSYMENCDFDIGYFNANSYSPNVILAIAQVPTAVIQAGDIIWLMDSASINTDYRAQVLNWTANSITVATGPNMIPPSSWPATSGTAKLVLMKQIPSSARYAPHMFAMGFSATHTSDYAIQVGNAGLFSNVIANFTTDYDTAGSNLTIAGFGYIGWATLSRGVRQGPRMQSLRALNCTIPQEAQRSANVSVLLSHNAAWEAFDLVGTQLSVFGEAKIRRGIGT